MKKQWICLMLGRAMLMPAITDAQQPADGDLDSLLGSEQAAQKRAESIHEVPIVIAAFSAENWKHSGSSRRRIWSASRPASPSPTPQASTSPTCAVSAPMPFCPVPTAA